MSSILSAQSKDYCGLQKQNSIKFASEKKAQNFVRAAVKLDTYCKDKSNASFIDSLINSSNIKVKYIDIGSERYMLPKPWEIELDDIREKSKTRIPTQVDSVFAKKQRQLFALKYDEVNFNFKYFITKKDNIYSIHDFDLNVLITNLQGVKWIYFNQLQANDEFIKIYKDDKDGIYDLKNKKVLGDRFAKNVYDVSKNEKVLFFLYDDRPVDLSGKYVFEDDQIFVKQIGIEPENFILKNKRLNKEVVYDLNMKPISKAYDFVWDIKGLFFTETNEDDYILDKQGKELKKLATNEKIETLPTEFGTHFIHTLGGEKSIVNEKLKIVNSLKYKDVKVINFINILFCKKGDNEIDLVDIDLDILSKLKTKSLHIAYNNNNGFYYIVNNDNTYYAIDVFGNQKSDKFGTIKELVEKNNFEIYKEIY